MRETMKQSLRYCPICGSRIAAWRIKHTAAGTFPIDRCASCHYAFANPRPTDHFLKEFYSMSGHTRDGTSCGQTLETVLADEAASPNSTVDAKSMLDTVVALLPRDWLPGAKLLDVGCGYGFFSREARDRGFAVTAIELAASERLIASKLIGVAPVNTAFEEFECAPGEYSVVLMSQILEHALDVNRWLRKTQDLLRDEGVLAIAVPNFGSLFRRCLQENEPFIIPPAHLNFFSGTNLALLLERHGFAVRTTRWTSRIRRNRLRERLPFFMRPMAGLANGLASLAFHGIDRARLGMMVQVFATKGR
jgi:2-polyprenyl-3-methyl-5-hydroxy-6-metoxy-1,4-benzoquinol methylase